MDPTVVVAIVGGGATVVGATIAAWATLRAQKATRQSVQTERAAVESVKKQAEEVAYTLGELEVNCTFDDNGSGFQERIIRTIRVKEPRQDFQMPFVFAASPPGRISPTPTVSELPGSKYGVQLTGLRFSEVKLEGAVEVLGLLRPGEPARGFSLRFEFERAIRTNRGEMQEAYRGEQWKTEYVSGRVAAPMDRMHLSVTFPPSHAALSSPPPGAVVFFGTETEVVNQEETARVAGKLTYLSGVATLDVENPVPSLRYAIWWMPPK